MKKTLYKIGIILNYFFALLLILSYLSVHVSPDRIPYLALFGLFFPFFIFINFFFLILRIYKKKTHFFISLIVLLLGINHIRDFYGFKNKEIESSSDNKLKVMSYNVRMFDLYKWSGEQNAGNKIFNIIKEEDADIICLQEFYSNKNNNWQDKIIDAQQTKDYIISSRKGSSYSGNAIFSRYPIINHGYVDIGSTNQKCIYVDIEKGNETVRVYNIHLASIHLSGLDYEFMKNLDFDNREENIEGVKGIGSKLLLAYKNRSREVDAIVPHIKKSPNNTIVCGDFNDTPVSYSYRKIKGENKDAFIEAGFGIGNTYAGNLPFFRIDYIMHSPELESINYKRIEKDYSDHYPVSATFTWNGFGE